MTEAGIFYSAQQVEYEVGDQGIGVRLPKIVHFDPSHLIVWVWVTLRFRLNVNSRDFRVVKEAGS
jgi:hypothetical protein